VFRHRRRWVIKSDDDETNYYLVMEEKALGPKIGRVDIVNLIRSIQRAERNPDCFGKAKGSCGQIDCTWRVYCLQVSQMSGSEDMNRAKDSASD
jgi:hypothetical protein